MDSFGKKYIFLNTFFLLMGTKIVLSDKQCDCESLSLLTTFFRQEIFQIKYDILKLRLELSSVSEGRNVVAQTSAGTTPIVGVSGLDHDNLDPAVEQRLDKLQSGFDELKERTNEISRIDAERYAFFKLIITNTIEKEKNERLNFVSRTQSLMEEVKGEFRDFKNTIFSSLEEHVLKTDQDLASHKNASVVIEKRVFGEFEKFKAKVDGDIETAGDQTALTIAQMLNTLKNSTENINQCMADIGAIKDAINNITSDMEVNKKAVTELSYRIDDKVPKHQVHLERDCKDILRTTPDAKSGQYTIFLKESIKELSVFCDMETDGGGWTVFQRRINGKTNFYRNYREYENGFGEISGEFWLGLKNIQELTKQGVTELRLDMTLFNGTEGNEIFQDFKLLDPEYTLQLGSHAANSEYKGKSGMLYNKGSGFSTYGHDVDTYSDNCPVTCKGAWWYRSCTDVNLNGDYSAYGLRAVYHWGLSGFKPLKSTSMMLRRTT